MQQNMISDKGGRGGWPISDSNTMLSDMHWAADPLRKFSTLKMATTFCRFCLVYKWQDPWDHLVPPPNMCRLWYPHQCRSDLLTVFRVDNLYKCRHQRNNQLSLVIQPPRSSNSRPSSSQVPVPPDFFFSRLKYLLN